ncbi:MAG: hypothetical protein IJK23_05610 [Clostridia bacterium]|nr:hypothetical protein [Clostridia bacterium]
MIEIKIEQYDTVLLKDGRRASIVEVLSPDYFIVDVGQSSQDWETIPISIEDIDQIVKKAV